MKIKLMSSIINPLMLFYLKGLTLLFCLKLGWVINQNKLLK